MKSRLSLMAHLVVLILMLEAASGLTIREIIEQRAELTKLATFMKQLLVMQEFGQTGTKKYTFFASANVAFENIPSQVSQHLQKTNAIVLTERDNIMRYQTVSGVLKTSDMLKNETLKSYGPDSNLFIFSVDGNYFMNGAQLLVYNIVASNGIVHIIDSLMYEGGQSINACMYITENDDQATDASERTASFSTLLAKYQSNAALEGDYNAYDELNGHSDMITAFVPSDEAIAKIPQQQLTFLMRDSVELKKVIEGHLILGAALHSNLLLRPEFSNLIAMNGRVVSKKFLGNVYVSNTCAQGMVTHGNITVKNGVVHIVDGLLGYVYSDAITLLNDQKQYQWFYSHVKGASDVVEMLTLPSGTTIVLESEMYTVFAPVLESDVDLTQDLQQLDLVMRMHLIKGRLEVSDMTNTTTRVTLNSEQTATFHQIDDAVYVEVNYVRAKVTTGDICVKNGILHNIDTVLGVPVYTIAEAISENTKQLAELYKAIRKAGLWTYLNDKAKVITMFAPVDKAFQHMLDDAMGRRLLDERYEENLKLMLNRHIITEEVFLDKITDQQTFDSVLGDTIDIVKVGTEYHVRYGSKEIGVIQANMRMTNGVLHLIEDALYSDDPNSAEWTSHAPLTSSCTVLLGTAFIYHILTLTG